MTKFYIFVCNFMQYLTNRFNFCVRLYCDRSQMTSSVIYYIIETPKYEIHLFYAIKEFK